ncbi:hypothetical protein B0H11DRAFT_2095923 [Mycena galericulata]|nr:hypothetical protein B0H11DRAFT_2095923 [Mycena galericulata]
MYFLYRSVFPFAALILAACAAPQAQEKRVPAVESQPIGRRGYVVRILACISIRTDIHLDHQIFEGKCAAVCTTNSDCTSTCGGVCGASKICEPSEGRYEA